MAISERWRKFWQSDSTRAAVQFEHWNEHITQDDIRVLFLTTLKEGNNVLVPAITSTELEYFQTTLGSLDVAADGQIQMASIVRFLAQAHGSRTDLIPSVASTIETLIASHAHFPFSAPVGMSKDALCRAIILGKRSANVLTQDDLRSSTQL
ncbi:hypothetical protein BU23DRAFT_299724 [Bimuria novae-zelandiae CBS 107.79]|uniref:Uncharacterized protein n=1 Tax=Bimuria novae-zelandiae CBS 107.79 TaxID=1447943 RepID=A0A6A5VK08_9PLEO|nr:hypothetical protein BU23DRAFT_299724 [Bimuria novae-zelandiae CBS 107.79]